MNQKINEMDDDYANGGYQSMNEPAVTMAITTPDGVSPADAVTMGSPTVNPSMEAKDVTVYANSINAVSYGGDSNVVAFDVVFSIGCICPESGRSETYQVVKRIGVDKMKLANEAKSSTPISIVEAQAVVAPEKFLVSKERARQIAGLR